MADRHRARKARLPQGPARARCPTRATTASMRCSTASRPAPAGSRSSTAKTRSASATTTVGGISLEPGGQFELSGAPQVTIHDAAAELDSHLEDCRAIGGAAQHPLPRARRHPALGRRDIPKMPKSRYGIMTAYMDKVGTLGTSMMYRSCTVQANLDFSDEADMVKKMRVSLALQPIVTALFANSPFVDGKPSGYLSFRSQIWLDTDRARTGMLPFAFERWLRLRRLCRACARCADVFRHPQWRVHQHRRREFPRLHATASCRSCPGETPHGQGLGEPPLDPVPRSAAQAVPRNARRRHGRPRPRPGAGRHLGRPALRPASRSMPPGNWSRTGPTTSAKRCATRCRAPRSRRRSATARSPTSPGSSSTSPPTASAAAAVWRRQRRNRSTSRPLEETLETGKTQADRWLDKYHGEWQGDLTRIFDEAEM